MPDASPQIPRQTIIRASGAWSLSELRELVDYREILYFLVWRDLKVRYKQTVLRGAWAVIQPLTSMVIFSILFGQLARMPSGGLPYPVFAYTALVPWTYFANAFAQASNSLVDHQHLITKVYFPRLFIPLASIVAGLVDLAIAFVVLIVLMLAYGIVPAPGSWAVPLLVLLTATIALGGAVWLSALNVRYRDVRYLVPFLVQVWLFASPIAYPSSLVPAEWRLLYGLNPMVGIVEGFRWALLGQGEAPVALLAGSAIVGAALLFSGLIYFRRAEERFADVI